MSSFCLIYPTPENFDDILLTSDGKVLTGLHFVKQYKASFEQKSLPIFQEVCRWLDVYFSGQEPDFTPEFRIENSTPCFRFRQKSDRLQRRNQKQNRVVKG